MSVAPLAAAKSIAATFRTRISTAGCQWGSTAGRWSVVEIVTFPTISQPQRHVIGAVVDLPPLLAGTLPSGMPFRAWAIRQEERTVTEFVPEISAVGRFVVGDCHKFRAGDRFQ